MRILGIDPGSRATGYGVVERAGQRLRQLEYGTIRPPEGAGLAERLKAIHDGLEMVIDRSFPDVMAIEQIFLSRSATAALKLGHARGAAMLAGANAGLPVFEYSALQVKSAVVGYGKAEKQQVQQMVRILLNLPRPAQQDAADALAVAICHAHSSR